MISMSKSLNMFGGKMCFNLRLLIKRYIKILVLGPIREHLSFYSYFVRIIILMVKISLEIRKIN
jgi:hypothetical protein